MSYLFNRFGEGQSIYPVAIFILQEELIFPDPSLANKDGLLAVGGDLQPERLLLAYKNGIFPWYAEGDPILWWSTDPRLVLYPNEIVISRSLKKTLRKGKFQTTIDHAFEQVIRSCAQARGRSESGTWITAEMIEAYKKLYRLGHAHSVETWFGDKLVGGLYGISIGHCFFGESMFSEMSDASKVALVHLTSHLTQWRFQLIDCQMPSDHLMRMGARLIPRYKFISQLNDALARAYVSEPWVSSDETAHPDRLQ